MIRQLSDKDAVTVEVIKGNTKIIAASMYFDRELQIENDLEKMEQVLLHAKNTGVIIAADTNARSALWYDRVTNERGRILEEFMTTKQLFFLNEKSSDTTYSTGIGKSNIDLTIISPQLLSSITGWEISCQESLSDHRIIKYNIKPGSSRHLAANHPLVRYRTNNESLQKFPGALLQTLKEKFKLNHESSLELDASLSSLVTEGRNIEALVDDYNEAVIRACDKTFSIQRGSRHAASHKSVPWWTAELTVLRKRTNALRRLYQRTKNDEELRTRRKMKYLESKSTYAATIKRGKSNSWKEFCNVSTATNPWGVIYNLATGRGNIRAQITTLNKPDGTQTANTKETLSYMMDTFAPKDNNLDDNAYHKAVRTYAEQPVSSEDDLHFTKDEVANTIGSMNKNKAPGTDGITGNIYKQVFNTVPTFVTALYNGCLKQGIFPKTWKEAKIIPCIKPGQEKSTEVTKYRPISLLNYGGKVLEKLLINRINHHATSTRYLNKNQYGFRPQTSPIDAVLALQEYIEDGFRTGEVTILVSLDVEAAFNAAWWPAILKSLNDSRCPRNLYNLTRSYFSNRRATLQTNNIKIETKITTGCPQGSCCGPGMWTIYYNSLLNLHFTHRTKTIAFADDLMLAIRGRTVSEAENMANVELTKIAAWARDNKVHFNEQKSKTILISRKRKERRDVMLYLNSRPLPQVQSLKYLGIIIDKKLTFKDHIHYITEKCSKLIFALSKSAKLNWGLGHGALKTIYTGAILPLLQYGAPIWIKALAKASYKIKLIRVQRLINIRMAKSFRTVSNEALCIINGQTPIDIKLEETAQLFHITRRNNSEKVLDTRTTTRPQNIDYDAQPEDWLHPADTVRISEHHVDNAIQIFTDGSKSAQGVGAGIAIFIQNELVLQRRLTLHSNCSNNQAEQLAIVKALETIKETRIPENVPREITIHTDSKITLQSLKNPKNHKHLINEIRKTAISMEKQNWHITFTWIRAHVGHYGNELADKLAKEAAGKDIISYNRTPMCEIAQQMRETSLENWQRQWDSTTKASTTKEFFPNIKDRLETKITITPNFTALVTSHGKTKSYLHRFKIIESPDCPCGGGSQTVEHLLFDCTILQEERERLIGKISRHDNWPVNKSQLGNKYIKHFIQFTKSIDFTKL